MSRETCVSGGQKRNRSYGPPLGAEGAGAADPDGEGDGDSTGVDAGSFGKSRELPLHPTTLPALRASLARRDRLHPKPAAASLFISTAGTRRSRRSCAHVLVPVIRIALVQSTCLVGL